MDKLERMEIMSERIKKYADIIICVMVRVENVH